MDVVRELKEAHAQEILNLNAHWREARDREIARYDQEKLERGKEAAHWSAALAAERAARERDSAQWAVMLASERDAREKERAQWSLERERLMARLEAVHAVFQQERKEELTLRKDLLGILRRNSECLTGTIGFYQDGIKKLSTGAARTISLKSTIGSSRGVAVTCGKESLRVLVGEGEEVSSRAVKLEQDGEMTLQEFLPLVNTEKAIETVKQVVSDVCITFL
jgi:hypothetical protein